MGPVSDESIDAVLAFPWELFEYQKWLEASGNAPSAGHGDYLFSEPRARFEVRPEDVLALLPGVSVRRQGAGVRFCVETEGAGVEVPGVSQRTASKFIEAIDGNRCLALVERRLEIPARELRRLLEATFGSVVFAPGAVAALESHLSGIEVTRFPGSPYEIVRPYWENMIAVRGRAERRLGEVLPDVERTVRLLRELHVIALMGEDLRTYYRPSSRISARGTTPGAFLQGEAQLCEAQGGTLFLSGPRVNVSLVGGDAYHRALYTQLDEPESLGTDRHISDAEGVGWGRIVTARATQDPGPAPWFCPPRPIQPVHLEGLVSALGAAALAERSGEREKVAVSLARFHWRFVHLHPFRCANQCLAMNLVNLVLKRSHGAGMPHQILDHFALRLSEHAYEKVFATAVQEYVLSATSPIDRHRDLGARKQRAYGFIRSLAECDSLEAALARVEACPEAARLALFPV